MPWLVQRSRHGVRHAKVFLDKAKAQESAAEAKAHGWKVDGPRAILNQKLKVIMTAPSSKDLADVFGGPEPGPQNGGPGFSFEPAHDKAYAMPQPKPKVSFRNIRSTWVEV
jgi:hypothetical protein